MDQSSLLITNLLTIRSLSSASTPKGLNEVLRTKNLFSVPNREAFEVVSYYLLQVLCPEALKAHQVQWPVTRDSQTHFKRSVYQIFTDLGKAHSQYLDDLPHSRYFNTYKGEEVLDFMWRLSYVALKKVSSTFPSLGRYQIPNPERQMDILRRSFQDTFRNMLECENMEEKLEELRAREKESSEILKLKKTELSELLHGRDVSEFLSETVVIKEILERFCKLCKTLTEISVEPPPEIHEEGLDHKSINEVMMEAENCLKLLESGALDKLTILKSVDTTSIEVLEKSLNSIFEQIDKVLEGLEHTKEDYRLYCETCGRDEASNDKPIFQSPMLDLSEAPVSGSGFTPKVPKRKMKILRKKEIKEVKEDREITEPELVGIIDSPSKIPQMFSPVRKEESPSTHESTPRRAPRPSIDRLIIRYKKIKESIKK